MGLRFQRRIRMLPGVHLNLSGSGLGVSIGGRGAHVGISARGRRYTSVGIPRTGLSWREQQHNPAARQCEICGPGHAHVSAWLVVLLVLLAAFWAVVLSGR
jgi:hypothetical protein